MQAEFDSADSFLATPLFMPDEDAGTNISEPAGMPDLLHA